MRVFKVSAKLLKPICTGEVSERFKEHAWKACVGEILPWVRIPPSPPSSVVYVSRVNYLSALQWRHKNACNSNFGGQETACSWRTSGIGQYRSANRGQRASTVTQVDERRLFLSPKTARLATSHLEVGKLGEIRKVRLPSKS